MLNFICMFYGTELIIVMLPQRVLLVFDICLVSCEVDVNCWWNKALPLGHNVSVLCHMSTRGRANSCGLCQLYVIKLDHRHQFASTCASTKETFNFSIAAEHRECIRCMCNGNTAETCNVTVRGGCEYFRIDHLSLTASLLALDMFRSQDAHNDPKRELFTRKTVWWHTAFGYS